MVTVSQSFREDVLQSILEAGGVDTVAAVSAQRYTAADYAEMNPALNSDTVQALRALQTAHVEATMDFRCNICLNVIHPANSMEAWLRAAAASGERNRFCKALICDFERIQLPRCYPCAPTKDPLPGCVLHPLEPALARLPPPSESKAEASERLAACPWLPRAHALRACRELRSRRYHQVHELKTMRKEFSESLAVVEAWALHGGGGEAVEQSRWRIVDLCCGKALTSTLLGLLRPHDVEILAVDLIPARYAFTHHAYNNVFFVPETDIMSDDFK